MTKDQIKSAVLGALWTFEKSGYTNDELADEVAKLLEPDCFLPVATTYTKGYDAAVFGDISKPLKFVTLKCVDQELAILPLKEIVHLTDDLREEIERWKTENKPDSRHCFAPNKKYPWFCAHCGYPPENPVMHSTPQNVPSVGPPTMKSTEATE